MIMVIQHPLQFGKSVHNRLLQLRLLNVWKRGGAALESGNIAYWGGTNSLFNADSAPSRPPNIIKGCLTPMAVPRKMRYLLGIKPVRGIYLNNNRMIMSRSSTQDQ